MREVLSVRERERDTETDGSDVTIVALKLAMSLHFPLPKVRTNGDEFTLSRPLAKNSHFSFLSSHCRLSLMKWSSFWRRNSQFCNEFTLSLPKDFFLLVPNLSNGASRATSNRKLKTNDQILPSPTLFLPSKN